MLSPLGIFEELRSWVRGECTSSVLGLLCSVLLLRFLFEAFVCASPFFTLPLVSLTFRSEGNSQDYIEFLSRVNHCAWYHT